MDLVEWGILGVGGIRTIAGPLSLPEWSGPFVATVGRYGHQENCTKDGQHNIAATTSLRHDAPPSSKIASFGCRAPSQLYMRQPFRKTTTPRKFFSRPDGTAEGSLHVL